MSKHLMTLLVVVLLTAFVVPSMPVRAQDDGGMTLDDLVVPACTAEEIQQINTALAEFNPQLVEAMQAVNTAQTLTDAVAAAQGLAEVGKAWEDLSDAAPWCTDYVMMSMVYNIVMSESLIVTLTSANQGIAASLGDTELADQFAAMKTAHTAVLGEYVPMMEELAAYLAEGTPILEEWFPACTEDDLASDGYTQLLALEPLTDDESAALTDLMDNGTASNDLLFAVDQRLATLLELNDSEDLPDCHEIAWHSIVDYSVFYNLETALSWATLGTSLTGTDLEAAVTEEAAAARTDFQDSYDGYMELFGTPAE